MLEVILWASCLVQKTQIYHNNSQEMLNTSLNWAVWKIQFKNYWSSYSYRTPGGSSLKPFLPSVWKKITKRRKYSVYNLKRHNFLSMVSHSKACTIKYLSNSISKLIFIVFPNLFTLAVLQFSISSSIVRVWR